MHNRRLAQQLGAHDPVKARTRRGLYFLATLLVTLAGSVMLAFLATYYYLKPTLPDVAQLRDVRLQVPLRIYTRDGLLLGQLGEQRRVPVRWEDIPPVVVQAVLAAEDDRFFEHPGIDWQGMVRAVLVAATTMEMSQGGSTLTQQLVRTTLITKERQLRRKLREIFLSLALENELTKQEIFTLFVNTQFLGQRAYGFAAAAETYFGKPLAEVNAAEAATLAGILQAPSRLNPAASVDNARSRRAYTLRRMRELGYLEERAYREALDAPLSRELHGPRVEIEAPYVAELVRQELFEEFGARIYSDGFRVFTTIDSRLQRASDVALRSAVLEYDRRHGYRGHAGRLEVGEADPDRLAPQLEAWPVVGGLLPAVVLNTGREDATALGRDRKTYRLPVDGLRWARPALGAGIFGPAPKIPADALKAGDVIYLLPSGGDRALLVQRPEVQGAFVALDPMDGAIVALSGGFDFYSAKFNRVTQARRQPGSSFKPFVYSAALEKGFTAASLILDAPVVYEAKLAEDGTEEEKDWRPVNDTGRFYGPTRLREALARSRNLVTIRLMRFLGVEYVRDYVQRFGLPGAHIPADLTAALGTAQLTPLEMATGFATFANGGSAVRPYLVGRLENTDGTIMKQATPRVVCRDCAAPEAASSSALRNIVAGDGLGVLRAADFGLALPPPDADALAPRAISEANAFIITDMLRDVVRVGTAQRARALGRGDLAGKTGTTNDGRDAWFSGFNPGLVGTAWIGFDQERPLGDKEEGARTALPMWVYFMREALSGRPEQRIEMPAGIINARISPETGELAAPGDPGAIFEYFLAEHLPAAGASRQRAGDPAAAPQRNYEDPIF